MFSKFSLLKWYFKNVIILKPSHSLLKVTGTLFFMEFDTMCFTVCVPGCNFDYPNTTITMIEKEINTLHIRKYQFNHSITYIV
jgi:hypothetical protein